MIGELVRVTERESVNATGTKPLVSVLCAGIGVVCRDVDIENKNK